MIATALRSSSRLRKKITRCSLLSELGVAASIICQRLMLGDADGLDLANYYRVIAAGVSMNDPAFNVGEGAIQQRRTAGALIVTNSVKPVLIFRGEASRYVLLIFGEDIDGEVLAFVEGFMKGGALVYASQDETGFERQGCEGAYSDSGRLTVL